MTFTTILLKKHFDAELLFTDTQTTDAKNSRHITGNFLKQIQMHLS